MDQNDRALILRLGKLYLFHDLEIFLTNTSFSDPESTDKQHLLKVLVQCEPDLVPQRTREPVSFLPVH